MIYTNALVDHFLLNALALHSASELRNSKMFYTFWILLFGLSCKLTLIAADSVLFPGFSHFLRNEKFPLANSLLNSIVESFEEQGRVYCIVIIYDDIDIGIKSNSLSKSEKTV